MKREGTGWTAVVRQPQAVFLQLLQGTSCLFRGMLGPPKRFASLQALSPHAHTDVSECADGQLNIDSLLALLPRPVAVSHHSVPMPAGAPRWWETVARAGLACCLQRMSVAMIAGSRQHAVSARPSTTSSVPHLVLCFQHAGCVPMDKKGHTPDCLILAPWSGWHSGKLVQGVQAEHVVDCSLWAHLVSVRVGMVAVMVLCLRWTGVHWVHCLVHTKGEGHPPPQQSAKGLDHMLDVINALQGW